MQEGGSRDPPAASCINPKRSIPSCAGTAPAGVPSHATHSTAMELPIALQFGASAVRSEADCNVGGHVGLPFVWRRAIALAGALKGRRKAPKAPGAFGSGGKKNHPWADWQARSSLEPSAHQQSHPAHVVAGAGIVWRTSAHKGSPFLRRRAPAPNTADREGSPDGSHRQAIGGPFAAAEGMQTRRTRGVRFAEKPPSGPAAGAGRTGRAHGARRRCALGRPAGHAGHGPRRRWRAWLTGNGGGQAPLRPPPLVRRGREAPRLDVPVATGSVPLQSG